MQFIKELKQNLPALINGLLIEPFSLTQGQIFDMIRDLLDKSKITIDDLKKTQMVDSAACEVIAVRAELADRRKAIEAVRSEVTKMSAQRNSLLSSALPSTRNPSRSYPIAPTDLDAIFFLDNIFTIADETDLALSTERPRATDIRAFLRHELDAAYDLLPYYEGLVEPVAETIQRRGFAEDSQRYSPLMGQYQLLTQYLLPGDLNAMKAEFINRPEPSPANARILQALSWAVCVESGLLNRQLREDMKRTVGADGFACDGVDMMAFHYTPPRGDVPDPGHPYWAAQEQFTRYVRARWPIITFALDPVTDQQNLGDAYSRERDLQLAFAFAFAAGRINFQQLNRYTQRLRYEAATIDLNRTVTSFAYGNDTFGWRFRPRYQTPPEERTNFSRFGNLALRGGPGRNYGLRNSKLEPGQRELTVVVIMPSILQRMRMEVSSNWFPLHDPDEMEIPTARMIEQGRRVVELRDCLGSADICQHYRPGDVQRMLTRVHQVESMLPMQTHSVQVPYENTLGGFQLFTQGSTALVPELLGYEGVDEIDVSRPNSILIFGKHIDIHETNVVAGGKVVSESLSAKSFKAIDMAAGAAADQSEMNTAGKQVLLLPSINAEILSRDVVRVEIPCGVDATLFKQSHAGRWYLEVYLATPNGISNRLLIPVKDHEADCPPEAPTAEAAKAAEKKAETEAKAETAAKEAAKPKFSYALASKTWKVNYQWAPAAGDAGASPRQLPAGPHRQVHPNRPGLPAGQLA